MLSLRTILRPSTGDFQIPVRTVFPLHITSHGRPTFTESNRGMCTLSISRACLESFACFTSDAPVQHHPRGGFLRSHDLLVPGKERLLRYPSLSPFSWSDAM